MLDSDKAVEWANDILDYFQDNNYPIKSHRININKSPYSLRKKDWLYHLPPEVLKGIGITEIMFLEEKDKYALCSLITEIHKEGEEDRLKERSQNTGKVPHSRIKIDRYVPLLNMEKEEVLIYDKDKDTLTNYDYSSFVKAMAKYEKDEFDYRMKHVRFRYDPYKIDRFIEGEDDGLYFFNLYTPPEWRLTPVDDPENIECPEIITELYEHLFPSPSIRELAIHWDHIALVGRNEAAKVLNARKGIGKQLYCDLLFAVMGENNADLVPKSFFESGFNSILANRRILLIDEHRIGKNEHTLLKRYMNEAQNIERKGIDVGRKELTHNNFLISSNDSSDMFLEWDDRRFLALETTAVPLIKIWPESKIMEFKRRIKEDKEMIRNFGYWLLYHGQITGRGAADVYKGKLFFKLVQNSLWEWQKFLLDKVLSGAREHSIRQLRREYKKEMGEKSKIPNPDKIRDFLQGYLHLGEHSLGDIRESPEEGPVIVANEFFVKDSLDFGLGELDEDLL